jgi:hypothetical protein
MGKKMKPTHESESIYMEFHPEQVAGLYARIFMDLYTNELLKQSVIVKMVGKGGFKFNGFTVKMDLRENHDKSICVSYDDVDEAALIYFMD